MKRGFWINDAYVALEGDVLAVGYRHHLDYVTLDSGGDAQFYAYRARAGKDEKDGWADDWGRNFAHRVERTGRMVIAQSEWDGGKVIEVGRLECSGPSLIIEVPRQMGKNISIGAGPPPNSRDWTPRGYADPEHLWNRPEARSNLTVKGQR